MSVLVVIPEDELRHQARDLLGASLRARDYASGLVLAEQNFITDAILWSPPGLDTVVANAIVRLRRLYRDVRIFVITPERLKPGNLGYCDGLQVDGYALESELRRVVQDVNGVPVIIERDRPVPTVSGGSSAACH
jgi:hypothetical protein